MRCAVVVPAFMIQIEFCTRLSGSPIDWAVAPGTAMVMWPRACSLSGPAKWYHTEPNSGFTRVKPEFGSVWYHLAGPDKEHARGHMTIAVPGATAQSMGLPDKRVQNSIWIMNAGTTTAHLMVPGE